MQKFFWHNDCCIESLDKPGLSFCAICVRGSDESSDENYACIDVNSSENAKKLLAKYIDIVKAYNQKLILSGDNQNEDDIEEVIAE